MYFLYKVLEKNSFWIKHITKHKVTQISSFVHQSPPISDFQFGTHKRSIFNFQFKDHRLPSVDFQFGMNKLKKWNLLCLLKNCMVCLFEGRILEITNDIRMPLHSTHNRGIDFLLAAVQTPIFELELFSIFYIKRYI